jgi:hypothetical protein
MICKILTFRNLLISYLIATIGEPPIAGNLKEESEVSEFMEGVVDLVRAVDSREAPLEIIVLIDSDFGERMDSNAVSF